MFCCPSLVNLLVTSLPPGVDLVPKNWDREQLVTKKMIDYQKSDWLSNKALGSGIACCQTRSCPKRKPLEQKEQTDTANCSRAKSRNLLKAWKKRATQMPNSQTATLAKPLKSSLTPSTEQSVQGNPTEILWETTKVVQ